MAKLTIVSDEDAVAGEAAERLTALVGEAIAARGSAVVSLTGGTTPRRLYVLLADPASPWRSRIDWARVHLYWGDERHVPPAHADSNFGMADAALIRHVPIPAGQVHRMRGEVPDPRQAAREYERALDEGFAAAGRSDRTFDVMLLGLGEDAHVASLFPGSPLLAADAGGPERPPPPGGVGPPETPARREPEAAHAPDRVAAVWAPHLNAWRITLTPRAVLDARHILMIVAGDAKADAVRAAIEEEIDLARRPAHLLRAADAHVEWIVDRGAARLLTDRPAPPDAARSGER